MKSNCIFSIKCDKCGLKVYGAVCKFSILRSDWNAVKETAGHLSSHQIAGKYVNVNQKWICKMSVLETSCVRPVCVCIVCVF